MRTTPDECREIARVIAAKLNAATGPTELFIPLRGVSVIATEGQVFHDPEADAALFETLRAELDPAKVVVHELDTDVNDPTLRARDGESTPRAHRGETMNRSEALARLRAQIDGRDPSSAPEQARGSRRSAPRPAAPI